MPVATWRSPISPNPICFLVDLCCIIFLFEVSKHFVIVLQTKRISNDKNNKNKYFLSFRRNIYANMDYMTCEIIVIMK